MTPDLWLALPRFAAACAGSVVLAFVLHALLHWAAARWPALRAHRSVWLSGQAAILAVLVLACAPVPRGAIAPLLTLVPTAVGATPAGAQSRCLHWSRPMPHLAWNPSVHLRSPAASWPIAPCTGFPWPGSAPTSPALHGMRRST